MATPTASTVGQASPVPEDDGERLGRRDLLLLKLELTRRRREIGVQQLVPVGDHREIRRMR
jgi:hypothetical protein